MNSKTTVLADLAKHGSEFGAPKTEADAETILKQLAGPFLDVSRTNTQVREVIPTPKPIVAKNAATEGYQSSYAAVKQHRIAFETIPDSLLIVDCDGTVALANSHLLKLFGYSRAESLGQSVELFVPQWFDECHRAFDMFRARQAMASQEMQGRHRDGHEIPIQISMSPLETDVGVMVVATIRDLTEQRRIESQVRRFEVRYRTLVEGLPAVTFMAALDDGMNELYVSPQIETLLGFSQNEWLGNPILWYTQLHPDDRKRWHTEFAATCSTGETFSSIYRFYSRDNRVVWVHGEAKVIRDDIGRPMFMQGVAFDITQLKEAEEKLRQLNQNLEQRVNDRTSELSSANDTLQTEIQERQRAEAEIRRIHDDLAIAHEEAIAANRTKSQFLANMSHELRTPLNAIIGYSELLQLLASRNNDETYNADLERINKAGKHLLALINDILDISKIEAGKMQLEMEIITVTPLVEDVIETTRPLADKNSNMLDVHIADDLGMISADIVKLKQCLLNLLSNACKFTQDGRITFAVTQECVDEIDWVMFRVQDTGIGLSDEQSSRLFQPFTQADASTTRKFGGTGLGLAITKKLCEAMDGDILLESQLGEGSTFTIKLPVHQGL